MYVCFVCAGQQQSALTRIFHSMLVHWHLYTTWHCLRRIVSPVCRCGQSRLPSNFLIYIFHPSCNGNVHDGTQNNTHLNDSMDRINNRHCQSLHLKQLTISSSSIHFIHWWSILSYIILSMWPIEVYHRNWVDDWHVCALCLFRERERE